MTKGKELPAYARRRKRDGKIMFRKRGHREAVMDTQFPEGAPIPFALHAEIQRRLSEPVQVRKRDALSGVIQHYRAHHKFTRLAPRTRADYEKRLAYLDDKLGHLHPRQIERYHVIKWHDAWAEKFSPHRANYLLAVLKVVLEHAIDMGLTSTNPAKGVKAHRYDKLDRQPWPADLIAAYRDAAPLGTPARLVMELCLGTGQRIGDVLAMRWSDLEDGGVHVRQSKTKARLWIPLTAPLRAALDATDRRSLFLLTNRAGTGPLSYRAAAHAVSAIRAQIGAEAYDIHSWRYTATAELAALGLDDATIQAVTGHRTGAMVAKYAGPARQKARAKKAQEARK